MIIIALQDSLAIAAVLADGPEFLILDESTAGLDAYRKRIREGYLKKIARLGRGLMRPALVLIVLQII
ncbi:hypothetical protein Psch_01558 [Pelotomaculum schinkii]|uniref:Uncharacterized protein n=1 Tax=Pelotomaculum schinkii TaxID=78350 RepID=A0A4Y7RGT7_9FIRM|nr:hypothetical protein [Pelotomaculum schinkii]TEB08003.1 hypothetical protein Psch_01558 [Pelotomaculum schinkii]